VVVIPNMSLDKPFAPFTEQTLRYQGVPQEGVAVGTLCRSLAFTASAVTRQSSQKEKLCIALSIDAVLLFYDF